MTRLGLAGWRHPRHPDFWFLVLLVLGLGLRIWYLAHPFDWFVSFFIADDCFYYLNTVDNIVHGHGSSVDGGLTSHNGFHPLFLLMLLVPAGLGVGKVGLVYWSMAILSLAWFAGAYLAYRLGSLWGSRVLALCLPSAMMLNIFFVRISLSGFETALASALFLAVLFALVRDSRGWVVGLLLGLTGLARVELLVLAIPVSLFLALRGRWGALLQAAGVSLLLTAPWFLWSFVGFGSLLPLSGVAKMASFRSEWVWLGFQQFTNHIPFVLGGYEFRDTLPAALACFLGSVALFLVIRDWRKTGWATLVVAIMLAMYGGLTNPGHVPQFIRYCVPAFLLLGIVLLTRTIKLRPVLAPAFTLALAVLVVTGSWTFYSWSSRTGTLHNFVGLGQARVPGILDQITGPEDLVGCFDSGSIGYFSDLPVINLDGLVNREIVELKRSSEGGSWTTRYRKYFADKGITVLVGGTRFSWVNLFPDLDTWERLHPPLDTGDGGQIIFVRVPPWPSDRQASFMEAPGPSGSPSSSQAISSTVQTRKKVNE